MERYGNELYVHPQCHKSFPEKGEMTVTNIIIMPGHQFSQTHARHGTFDLTQRLTESLSGNNKVDLCHE